MSKAKQINFIQSLPHATSSDLNGSYNDDLDVLASMNLLRLTGGEIQKIKADFASVMHSSDGKPSNLLCYPDNQQPTPAFAHYDEAVVFGNLKHDKIAVIGLSEAKALYDSYKDNKIPACIVCLPKSLERRFLGVIKAFKPSKVFTTHDKAGELEQALNGVYDGDIISVIDVQLAFENCTPAEVIAHNDTRCIELTTWGEMVSLSDDVRPSNPYPIEAFGDELATVITKIAHYTQTPKSWVGQSVLGCLSAIGQCHVNAPLGHTHKPASLYILTQGESGAGKSHIFDLVYRAYNAKQNQLNDEFLSEWQAWKENQSLPRKERLQMDKPINQMQTVQDATIEKIKKRFIHDDIKNQAWLCDEAGAFFGGHSMTSDTFLNTLSSLTKLWSNGYVSRERAGDNDNPITFAKDCRFTFDLAGQPRIIKDAFINPILREQGIFARFLFCAEPSLIGKRDHTAKANIYLDSDVTLFWERCKAMMNTPCDFDDDADDNNVRKAIRKNINLTNEASDLIVQYKIELEPKLAKDGIFGDDKATAGRLVENACRIATLLAFYYGKDTITATELQRAFALVNYSMQEVINYSYCGNGEKSDIEKLLAWLIKKGDNINKTPVNTKAPYRGKYLNELLADLENANYIQIVKVGRSQTIRLNPKLLA